MNNKRILLLTKEISVKSVYKLVIDQNIGIIKLYNLGNNYLNNLQRLFDSNVSISFLTREEYDIRELFVSRSKSYDFIDIIYQYLINNNEVPLNWAMHYYKDIDIERAFKKELINQISKWLELEKLSTEFSRIDSQVYTLVDKNIYNIYKIFKKLNLINSTFIVYSQANLAIFDFIKSYMKFILIPFYIITKYRLLNISGARAEFDVAIRLHKTIEGVSHKYNLGGCDALKPYLINKNTTFLYVVETMPDSTILSDIERNKDHIIYTDRFFFRNIYVLFLFLFRVIKEQFFNIFKSIPLFIKSTSLFHNLLSKLYYDYCKWSCFCENNNINSYVSTNNQDLSSVTRNILLHRNGVKTVHYSQSWSDYYYLNGKDSNFRQPDRAFSLYHTQFYICGRQKEYAQSHNGKSAENLISGALIDSSRQYEDLKESVNMLIKNNGKKIISVFTASNLNTTLNGETDLISFLNFIVAASNDIRFNNYVFIVRFKHGVPDIDSSSMELQEVLNVIFNSPNIVIPDSKYSASFMLSMSFFVVSMSFTGPTMDALFARISACFYSVNAQTYGSIFDKCTGLIVRNVNDMYESLCYFDGLSDQEFDNYFINKLPMNGVKNDISNGYEFIANKLSSL